MGLFDSLGISATGLSAERIRMDVIAENLANAQTTQGAGGGPYQRKEVVLRERGGFGAALASAGASGPQGGVEVAAVVADKSPPRRVYDPGNPSADARGYVSLPNVNPVEEMVDLISSSRSYEANVTAIQSAKSMFARTLDILR